MWWRQAAVWHTAAVVTHSYRHTADPRPTPRATNSGNVDHYCSYDPTAELAIADRHFGTEPETGEEAKKPNFRSSRVALCTRPKAGSTAIRATSKGDERELLLPPRHKEAADIPHYNLPLLRLKTEQADKTDVTDARSHSVLSVFLFYRTAISKNLIFQFRLLAPFRSQFINLLTPRQLS